MVSKIVYFLVLFAISLNASNYSASSNAMATDKKSACQKALNSAGEDALAQAGTFMISSFSSSTSVNNDKYNSIKNKELKSISVGVAKLVSKDEDVKVTPDYQFNCKVTAIFSIDEDDMKKAIDKYLASSKKQISKNIIYIKSVGYSEEGQSRYRAIKAATIDAKRNLLDEIKGSELFSIIEARDGQLESDKVINNARGTIRFVKILSRKYDSKTRSAEVTVGMTKKNLEKNLNRWQEN
jgi:hypothetical protein